MVFFTILYVNMRLFGANFFLYLFKFSINSYFFYDIYWLKNKEILFNIIFFWLLNTQKNSLFSILTIFDSIYLKIFKLKYFLFIIEHLKKINSIRLGL